MADLKYTRTNWKDYPDETTPVNAANLNNIENGIEINKTNIDKLSTNGITFEKGDFSVGTDVFGEEFLYAPRSSNLIVESSNDNILALINEGGYLQLPHVTYPTTDNDAATKIYVDTNFSKATNVSNGSGSSSVEQGSFTTASGGNSHAEGSYTKASGMNSHAEGEYTIASGVRSHARGYYTNAGYANQTAIGLYNDNKDNTLFEVGNGENPSVRSNAFEVYKDGHAEVSLMGSTDNSIATKEYIDNAVSALASMTDYGSGIIRSFNSNFTITYQHTVRIGKIVFVHFTFTLAEQIDSGIYPFAEITNNNLFPNHDHGTIICGYNDSMTTSSALRTDSAVIKTDGSIWFRAVASGTSSNFSYDVSCFYSLTDIAFNALN